jgi:hypothetical protein
MFDICEREIGLSLHIDNRTAAIAELAKLLHFQSKWIVDHKAKLKPLADYIPDTEETLLETSGERIKIENAARMLADHIWKPFIAKCNERRPLVEKPGCSWPPPRLHKKIITTYRKHMHYVPQSTTRQWVRDGSGQFTVYTIGIDGEVRSARGTPRGWGAAPSLYSQRLEHLLGLIEGDAAQPYQKLVNVVPLSERDVRCWVAFLTAQLIRTPRFMRRNICQVKAWIEKTGFPSSTDPAHLGRGYETLFQNNELYAHQYRLIAGHVWSVVRAANGLTFLKGDNPVVISGHAPARTWQLIYPLTPERCFVAGPICDDEHGGIVPRQKLLTDAETNSINAATCSFAETSVIGVNSPERIDPKRVIKEFLAKETAKSDFELPFWGLDLSEASDFRRPRRRRS